MHKITYCPYEFKTSILKGTFLRPPKKTQSEKDNLSNKCCREKWISTCKRRKLYLYCIPFIKINSKIMKNLNVRLEAIKILEENIRETWLL